MVLLGDSFVCVRVVFIIGWTWCESVQSYLNRIVGYYRHSAQIQIRSEPTSLQISSNSTPIRFSTLFNLREIETFPYIFSHIKTINKLIIKQYKCIHASKYCDRHSSVATIKSLLILLHTNILFMFNAFRSMCISFPNKNKTTNQNCT